MMGTHANQDGSLPESLSIRDLPGEGYNTIFSVARQRTGRIRAPFGGRHNPAHRPKDRADGSLCRISHTTSRALD